MSTTYPIYVSPDGKHTQPAGSPAQRVRLEHAGWRLKSEPRRKKPRTGGDTGRPPPPANTANS